MAIQGKEYRLQGCFGGKFNDDIGLLLGKTYTRPETSEVSLSSCLEVCATIPTPFNKTYPYVGVAGGDSCYCGYQLDDSAAVAVDSAQCTIPCQGNAIEACGGANSMSIYKLATASDIPTLDAKDTEIMTGEDTSISVRYSTNDSMSPGVSAGIAMGTIIGVGVLLAVTLTGLKWRERRKRRSEKRPDFAVQPNYQFQLQPRQIRRESIGDAASTISTSLSEMSNTMWTTTSATPSPLNTASSFSHNEEKITIGDATVVDLKRLSGIIVDGRSSPRKGVFTQRDGHLSTGGKAVLVRDGNIHQIEVIATSSTTGAQWRHTQNLPLTPRTPRGRTDLVEEDNGLLDDEPLFPSIPIQEPDNVAQNYGLGDRAWHRRRLSMPFLPSGGDSTKSMEDVCGSSRYNPSGQSTPNWRPATGVSSRYNPSGQSTPNWRPATGVSNSIRENSTVNECIEEEASPSSRPPVPRPLRVDVISPVYNDEDDDGPALSPSWIWTVSRMPELFEGEGMKASKAD